MSTDVVDPIPTPPPARRTGPRAGPVALLVSPGSRPRRPLYPTVVERPGPLPAGRSTWCAHRRSPPPARRRARAPSSPPPSAGRSWWPPWSTTAASRPPRLDLNSSPGPPWRCATARCAASRRRGAGCAGLAEGRRGRAVVGGRRGDRLSRRAIRSCPYSRLEVATGTAAQSWSRPSRTTSTGASCTRCARSASTSAPAPWVRNPAAPEVATSSRRRTRDAAAVRYPEGEGAP